MRVKKKIGIILIVFGVLVMLMVGIVSFVKRYVENKKVVVLLQNSNEIRPSGGFMGSYLSFEIQKYKLTNIIVEDIYQPDGQIKGHVEPPYPIQEAFGQGWWRLRDANWDVDFERAGTSIDWFFKEGGVSADYIVAVNLNLVRKLLQIFGEVKPVTYDEVVTASNLDTLAQKYAQVDFAPGSSSKRDFLGAVGVQVEERMLNMNLSEMVSVVMLVKQELQKGEILIWSKDELMRKWLDRFDLLGKVRRAENQDLLYVVDTNLGVNKANCCVEKQVEQTVWGNTNEVKVKWKNNNPFEQARPPVFWGGDYINYVRVVVPDDYEISEVVVGERVLSKADVNEFSDPNSLRQGFSEDIYVVEKRDNLKIIGMWVFVKALKEEEIKLKLVRGGSEKFDELLVVKQPGSSFDYKLINEGKIQSFRGVEKDLVISGYGK